MSELSATRLVPHDTAESGAVRVEADDYTVYDGDVFYTPLIFADGRVGYSVRNHEGQEEFIYLYPSERDGDPNQGDDLPHAFYSVGEDFD